MENERNIDDIYDKLTHFVERINDEREKVLYYNRKDRILSNLKRIRDKGRTYLLTDAFLFYIVFGGYSSLNDYYYSFGISKTLWEYIDMWLTTIATRDDIDLVYYYSDFPKFFLYYYNRQFQVPPFYLNDKDTRGGIGGLLISFMDDDELALYKKLFVYSELARGNRLADGIQYAPKALFGILLAFYIVMKHTDLFEKKVIELLQDFEEIYKKMLLDGVIDIYNKKQIMSDNDVKTYINYYLNIYFKGNKRTIS